MYSFSPDTAGSSAGKESAAMQETWVPSLGPIPDLVTSPGEGNGYPLQYSGLENSVHGISKSQTQLRDFYFNIDKVCS